jgi:myosin X
MVDKYLEEKSTIADVLSKWEKYEAHGINPDGGSWQLLFKLFSFYDPLNPKLSVVEQKFLFEQAFESVMNRKFPADAETLNKLAALRMQYVVGDYEEGAYISDVVKVHPAQQPQLLSVSSGNTIVGTLKKMGKAVGTLRGFGSRTLKRLKGGTMKKKDGEPTDEDIVIIKQEIVMCWQQLKNMSVDDARIAYMDIIHSWNGYGANLFDVEYVQQTKNGWPKELWLAISLDGVGIFPRNERECLAYYQYESVLSFGAPVANKYKIMVDNVGSMLFETNMVLEIAKLMKEYIKEIVTRNK